MITERLLKLIELQNLLDHGILTSNYNFGEYDDDKMLEEKKKLELEFLEQYKLTKPVTGE